MQLGATFTMKPCREKAKSIYLHVRASSSRVTNSSTMDTLRALRYYCLPYFFVICFDWYDDDYYHYYYFSYKYKSTNRTTFVTSSIATTSTTSFTTTGGDC